MSLPLNSSHHTPPDSPRPSSRSTMTKDRDPNRAVDSLVDAIRDLASDDSYKTIADAFRDARDLRTENTRLMSSHRDVLEEYRKFRNELEAREAKLLEEKQENEQLKGKMSGQIEQLEGKNRKLDAEVEKGLRRLDEESQKCLELSEKMNAMDGVVANLQTTLQTKSQLLDELAGVKAKLTAEVSEAKETLEAKAKAIEGLEAAKTEVDDQLSVAVRSLEDKCRELSDAQESKLAVDTELKSVSARLDEKTQESEGLTVEKGHLSNQLAEAIAKLDGSTREFDKLSELKKKLEAELTETHEKLEEKRKEAESLLTQWEEAKSMLDTKSREMDQLIEAKAIVDTQLKQTATDLDSARVAAKAVDDELQDTKNALQQETAKASILLDELVELRTIAEERDNEIGLLKSNVAESTKRSQEAGDTIKQLGATIERLDVDLKAKTARLDEVGRYQIELEDEPEDACVEILDTIWVSILELAEKHFSQDLDESVLRDPSCWASLRSSEYLKHAVRIPLPQSNSQAAKQMRIAAVLAVLSRALSKHVFRPSYLIDNDVELVQVLRSLEAVNPRQEHHIRSALLAVLPDREKRNAVRRTNAVVREVSYLVQHLLSALQYEAFCTALEASCGLACRQWGRIQHAAMKIEPYFGPPFDDFDWQVLLLPETFGRTDGLNGKFSGSTLGLDAGSGTIGGNTRLVQDPPAKEKEEEEGEEEKKDNASITAESIHTVVDPVDIMLVLWPSMCAVEGGELVSITQGLVMAKEQAAAAFEEEGRRRFPQRRARSMSISRKSTSTGTTTPANGFLGPGKAPEYDGPGANGCSGKDAVVLED